MVINILIIINKLFAPVGSDMVLLYEKVVLRIAAKWNVVAYHLKLDMWTIDLIKEECQADPKKCCMKLLEGWFSSRGFSTSSWSGLINVLSRIKCLTAAVQVIKRDLNEAGVRLD